MPILSSIFQDIIDEMVTKLNKGHSIEIKNFGTFSPYITAVHNGQHNITGQRFITSPTKSVKFHTHCNMRQMIMDRREMFMLKKKSR